MARIGLIDVDGHRFPNIPLMKLSYWHKRQGDTVEWLDPFSHYDIAYLSKVFSFTPDYTQVIDADRIVRGGTGYAIHGAGGEQYRREDDKNLPYEIEHSMPDYSLYNIKDTAYGFLTRGCPRGCHFCIVGRKEGLKSVKVADLDEFYTGQKNIVLCDPNILAAKECEDLLRQLADTKADIDINQGLDVRLLTEKKMELINRLRMKEIHFAWDRYQDKDKVLPKLRMFSEMCKSKTMRHGTVVYVLVNYDTTVEQDLERIYTIRELDMMPYVMVYDKQHCSKTHKDMQRWTNDRGLFYKCKRFEDYNKMPTDKKQCTLF